MRGLDEMGWLATKEDKGLSSSPCQNNTEIRLIHGSDKLVRRALMWLQLLEITVYSSTKRRQFCFGRSCDSGKVDLFHMHALPRPVRQEQAPNSATMVWSIRARLPIQSDHCFEPLLQSLVRNSTFNSSYLFLLMSALYHAVYSSP